MIKTVPIFSFRALLSVAILVGSLMITGNALAIHDLKYPALPELQTRFGKLTTADGDGSYPPILWRDDRRALAFERARYIGLLHVHQFSPDADLVVLYTSAGGNLCEFEHVLLEVSAEGILPVADPSTCSWPLDIRGEEGRLEIDLASHVPGVSHSTFIWDGKRLSEIENRRHDLGATIAGPGPDVTRWIGKYPFQIIGDPGERLRFKQIMTEEEFLVFEDALGTASPVQQDGDFVYGSGFNKYFGASAWAIRISDGHPFAAVKVSTSEESYTKIYGGEFRDLPPQLKEFLERPF